MRTSNYSSKIIDPIQSRCTLFRFRRLEQKQIKSLSKRIAKKEGLTITDDGYEALMEITGGDVRRLVNVIQSASAIKNEIDSKLLYKVSSFAEPKEIREVLQLSIQGDFEKAKKKLEKTMLKQGLSGFDVIRQLQREAWNLDVDDKIKLEMVKQCGEVEFRMVEGSDEGIQLDSLIAKFVLQNKN